MKFSCLSIKPIWQGGEAVIQEVNIATVRKSVFSANRLGIPVLSAVMSLNTNCYVENSD